MNLLANPLNEISACLLFLSSLLSSICFKIVAGLTEVSFCLSFHKAIAKFWIFLADFTSCLGFFLFSSAFSDILVEGLNSILAFLFSLLFSLVSSLGSLFTFGTFEMISRAKKLCEIMVY